MVRFPSALKGGAAHTLARTVVLVALAIFFLCAIAEVAESRVPVTAAATKEKQHIVEGPHKTEQLDAESAKSFREVAPGPALRGLGVVTIEEMLETPIKEILLSPESYESAVIQLMRESLKLDRNSHNARDSPMAPYADGLRKLSGIIASEALNNTDLVAQVMTNFFPSMGMLGGSS